MNAEAPRRAGYRNLAVTLGLVSAVGPFAIDMYLPALPEIGRSLQVDVAAVQLSLTAFFVAMGLGQLAYGPLADRFGRKPPLYAGLGLFVLASVGCAFAPSIGALVVFRALQGLGACAGAVVPRAVVRDLYTGTEAARLMALLMLVFSVSPLLAPLAGSVVVEAAGWRPIFAFVALAGLVALGLVFLRLAETLPPLARQAGGLGTVLASYRQVAQDRGFAGFGLAGGFGMATFFIYLANASFVLIEGYGLTPRQFSLFFAGNAFAFIGAAQFNARLARRIGLRGLVLRAAAGFAAAMGLLYALAIGGIEGLGVLVPLLALGYGCLGLVLPALPVLAMEAHGARAGTASALLGTVQMLVAAGAMTLAGHFADGTLRPMLAAIALCAAVSLAFVALAVRRPAGGPPAP